MRTGEQVLREIAEAEMNRNRLIMEIGQGYAIYHTNKSEDLLRTINTNVELFNQISERLRVLREEIINLN